MGEARHGSGLTARRKEGDGPSVSGRPIRSVRAGPGIRVLLWVAMSVRLGLLIKWGQVNQGLVMAWAHDQ